MGVLTLYLFYVERGIFFVGIVRDPTGLDPESILSLSSNLKRFALLHLPDRNLTILPFLLVAFSSLLLILYPSI